MKKKRREAVFKTNLCEDNKLFIWKSNTREEMTLLYYFLKVRRKTVHNFVYFYRHDLKSYRVRNHGDWLNLKKIL